jgi:hypothetical protein
MQYGVDLTDAFEPPKQSKSPAHEATVEGEKKYSTYGDYLILEDREDGIQTPTGSDRDLIFPDQVDLEDD